MRKTKAFTLIELLIVVVIIGILATFVIIALLGATKKAKDTRAKDAVKTVEVAADLMVNEKPSAIFDVLGGIGTVTLDAGNYPKLKDEALNQLLKSAPQDAADSYVKIKSNSAGAYAICAQGINAGHTWFATSTTNNLNTASTDAATCPSAPL